VWLTHRLAILPPIATGYPLIRGLFVGLDGRRTGLLNMACGQELGDRPKTLQRRVALPVDAGSCVK
jgi:hypothetical protein